MIQAMPKRKRFFSIDVFPKLKNEKIFNRGESWMSWLTMDETSTSPLGMVLSLERSVFRVVFGESCSWCCPLRGLYLERSGYMVLRGLYCLGL